MQIQAKSKSECLGLLRREGPSGQHPIAASPRYPRVPLKERRECLRMWLQRHLQPSRVLGLSRLTDATHHATHEVV